MPRGRKRAPDIDLSATSATSATTGNGSTTIAFSNSYLYPSLNPAAKSHRGCTGLGCCGDRQEPSTKRAKPAPLRFDPGTYENYLRKTGVGPTTCDLGEGLWALREAALDGGAFLGLHPSEFVLIRNVVLQCSDGPLELLVCSCDEMDMTREAIDGFPASAHTRREAAGKGTSLSRQCVHVKTLKNMAAKNCVFPRLGEDRVVRSDPFLAFHAGAFIAADARKQYVCKDKACHYASHSCSHIHEFVRWIRERCLEDVEPFCAYTPKIKDPTNLVGQSKAAREDDKETIGSKRSKAVSHHPISLERWAPGAARRVECKRVDSVRCVPDDEGCCPKCSSGWDFRDPVEQNWIECRSATIYGPHHAEPAVVYYRKCTTCDCKKSYDGNKDGYFNYSNHTLFRHEVLLTYTDSITRCKMPLKAYHLILSKAYKRSRSPIPMCHDKTLASVIVAYMNRLDIDYKIAYECPTCSKHPMSQRAVVMDGKVMGFKSNTLESDDPPATRRDPPAPVNTASMCLVPAVSGGPGPALRAYARGEHVDVAKLRRLLKKHGLVSVLPLVPRDAKKCPETHRRFLSSVSTVYPVKDTATRNAATMARNALDDGGGVISRVLSTTLQTEWPALFSLIKGTATFPEPLVPLLRDVLRLILDVPPEHRKDVKDPPKTHKENPLAYFPNLPLCRPSLCMPGTSREYWSASQKAWCTKRRSDRVRNMTPGIFALFCPHGVCLGFEAMRAFEGPMTAADILYRRFEDPPGVVVYDNACALARVCAKYAGAHFANTKFLIDRMHWRGHTSCHRGYCIDDYRNCTILGGTLSLAAVNTQVCEQANSKLELIRVQSKYMRQQTFMTFTKVFLALRNIS